MAQNQKVFTFIFAYNFKVHWTRGLSNYKKLDDSVLLYTHSIDVADTFHSKYRVTCIECILPVARFLGNTIALSNCTIVEYKCCSDVTTCQILKVIVAPLYLAC